MADVREIKEVKLNEEQARQVKEKLLQHLVNVPEDKREQVRKQIEAMSTADVKEFIRQGQAVGGGAGGPGGNVGNSCVFCSIVSGKTESVKVDEEDSNIAILEINPFTRGHVLVISKKHEDAPLKKFVKKVGKNLEKKLKPKEVKVQEAEVMGHKVVNLIPIYNDADLGKLERKQASWEELEKVKGKLVGGGAGGGEEDEAENKKSKKQQKKKPLVKLKPRIP